MGFRVYRVGKLAGDEGVGDFFCQFVGFIDSSLHPFFAFREDDFTTVGGNEVAPFDGHGFRHGEDSAVAFGGGDSGQADARVAACRFNDNCAGLQETLFLGVVQHRFYDTVLYATCRVEILKLRVDFRVQFICFFVVGEFKKRSAADEVCDFPIYTHGKVSLKYFI